MSKLQGRLRFLIMVEKPAIEKENSQLSSVKLNIKIDLMSQSAWVDRFG